MHNRNEVKWNPFNSLMNGNKIVNDLDKNHQKFSKPTLSEDQLNEISKKLFDALTTKSLINLKYYENGFFYNIEGIIKFYDKNHQYIIINHKNVYLNQIIDIIEITY